MSKKTISLLTLSILVIGLGACEKHIPIDEEPSDTSLATEQVEDQPLETQERESMEEICAAEYQVVIDKYARDFSGCYGTIEESECEKRKEELESKTTNIVLIMDASGSMAAQIGGQRKMEIAKTSATSFVESLESNVNLSLIVYGHKGSNSSSDQEISCEGVEEILPLNPIDTEAAKTEIDKLEATGWTPIEGALVKASEVLGNYPSSEYRNVVILISDGEETCGGEPVGKATELFDSEINMVTNVIGFDVGDIAESQLKRTAENGGGTYYSVYSSEELNTALAMMLQMECVAEEGSQLVENSLSVAQAFTECSSNLIGEWDDMIGVGGSGALSPDKMSSWACYEYSYDKYMERYNNIFDQIEGIYKDQAKEIKNSQ